MANSDLDERQKVEVVCVADQVVQHIFVTHERR